MLSERSDMCVINFHCPNCNKYNEQDNYYEIGIPTEFICDYCQKSFEVDFKQTDNQKIHSTEKSE